MDNRKLVVTGKGQASKTPDAIEINIALSTINKKYAEAVNTSTAKVQSLLNGIVALGIKDTDLKTTKYGIRTVYKSEQDFGGNWKQVFQGYSCDHDLSLEINMNMKLLGDILNVVNSVTTVESDNLDKILANADKQNDTVNIRINFTLKDKEKIKNEAVENAIITAKEKADTLAKASGVTLGEIIDINYSFGIINIYSNTTYDKEMSIASADVSIGKITPEDIKINDTVTITWNIQ